MDKHTKVAASILRAIANPYRLQILAILMAGEKNVGDLNKNIKISQPALTQHLAKMRRAGILKARGEGRARFYFIADSLVLRVIGTLAEMVEARKAAA